MPGFGKRISRPQAAKLDALQMHSYRLAAGQVWDSKKSIAPNSTILEKSRKAPVLANTSIDRLRMFFRVANHESNVIRSLLDCTVGIDGMWLSAGTKDLEWARKMLPRHSDLPTQASIHDWVLFAKQTDALTWKKMLSMVAAGYTDSSATLGPWETARAELNGIAGLTGLEPALFSMLGVIVPPSPVVDRKYICNDCGKHVDSSVAWGRHRQASNGVTRKGQLFAEHNGFCQTCLFVPA